MTRRVLAIIVALFMLVNCPPIGNADQYEVEIPNSEEDTFSVDPIVPDTPEAPGGVLVELFSMHANAVYHELDTTESYGKCVYRNTFPGAYVYLQGRFTHSIKDATQAPKIRVALGYATAGDGSVYPSFPHYPTPGNDFVVRLCSRSSLNSNTAYYLVVTNYLGDGYVSGDMSVCYVG